METQSEDREIYTSDPIGQWFTQADIHFKKYIKPEINAAVKQQFQECMIPVLANYHGFKTRIRISKIIFIVILFLMTLIKGGVIK